MERPLLQVSEQLVLRYQAKMEPLPLFLLLSLRCSVVSLDMFSRSTNMIAICIVERLVWIDERRKKET
jgi:hypothetical protein